MSFGFRTVWCHFSNFQRCSSTPSSNFLKMIQTTIAQDVQNISVKALLQNDVKRPDCFVLETNGNFVTRLKDQWMKLITTLKSEHCNIVNQFLILCYCECYYMGSKAFTISNPVVLVSGKQKPSSPIPYKMY